MSVIAFDTETWPIMPGCLAPRLVCMQWRTQGNDVPVLRHRDHARVHAEILLTNDNVLVGHNVAYDMAVLGAQWPELLPAIFAKYERGKVTDTKIRDQLLMIARGEFRAFSRPLPDGTVEIVGVQYDLSACIARHFGRHLKKEGFRLYYAAFDEHPDTSTWPAVAKAFQDACRRGEWPSWDVGDAEDRAGLLAARPEEAIEYALADATTTLELHQSQERVAAAMAATMPGVLEDQYRQTYAAFCLHLTACRGMHTDPDAVDALAAKLETRRDELMYELQQEGIIREDGTADTKAAQDAMVAACQEEGIPVAMTGGGKKPRKDGTLSPPQVSLSSEACDRFEESSVIGMYSAFLTVRKTLSNDIKMLRAGAEDIPIQPRYDLADTGRTRCAKPNIQAINRGEGIREAFRPREGYVFIQADFEGLELHTLAQWCVAKFGKSELARKLNAKVDVHTEMAAEFLGITYEEAMARKKAGDKVIKEYRQRAKAVNFGNPGGLGAKKLVRYAKANYGVTMTLEEAVASKTAWLRKLPEMVDFFRLAGEATVHGDATERHVYSGRWRGGARYTALCNGRFQGLGADAAKAALCAVSHECYVVRTSPLFGCYPVAFVHDEIIAECPDDPMKIDAAARMLGQVMCEAANDFLPDVPVRCDPQAMRKWSKNAVPVYDADGLIIPWTDTT